MFETESKPGGVVGYWCIVCGRYVKPIEGVFRHPDRGEEKGLVCPTCKKPVMIKEEVKDK